MQMLHLPNRDKEFNLMVNMFSTQATMPVTEEATIFNGFDLIASVGGYLGLYLGASIITIYQTLAEIGESWIKYL